MRASRANLAGRFVYACAALREPFRGEAQGWRIEVERTDKTISEREHHAVAIGHEQMTTKHQAELAAELFAACVEADAPFKGEIGGWRIIVARIRHKAMERGP